MLHRRCVQFLQWNVRPSARVGRDAEDLVDVLSTSDIVTAVVSQQPVFTAACVCRLLCSRPAGGRGRVTVVACVLEDAFRALAKQVAGHGILDPDDARAGRAPHALSHARLVAAVMAAPRLRESEGLREVLE